MRLARYMTAAILAALMMGLAGVDVASAQDYDMSFSLPSYGKSGCMVCHGDPNLVRLRGDQAISYWVDEALLKGSAHADIQCTGCHVDFSFKAPHTASGADWRATAKLSCKNCHEEAWLAYGLGVHSISVQPGEEQDANGEAKPLCGDCHGSHSIMMLTSEDDTGRRALHREGFRVCGACHEDAWNSYDDYYHGAAYRRGAPDAPACWDCHGAHTVLPSDDRRSKAYEAQLPETCGECHKDVEAGYLEYVSLIHGRDEVLAENPVYDWIDQVRDGIGTAVSGIVGAVRSLLT